ncbi:mechanosensitive ion channel family protein [Luteolibacter soli]|uniref:mechanosensitive ion channel family protein n=1 Tax=Luteolibacter soli TaxID=3135280 RepID=UPI0031199166
MARILRETALPLGGLVLVAVLDRYQGGGFIREEDWQKVAAVSCILLGFSLVYRLLCSVVLDLAVAKSKGRPVPKILKHLIGIVFIVAAALLSVNVVFSGALPGLLTLSSVIAVVVGLALRPIILDIFSGLSANIDSAFHIGDWIEIPRSSGGNPQSGWVEEINWRTTHLRTRAGNLVVCPNSVLSTAIITNFSQPSRLSRFDMKVKLPPELDPDRGREVLLAAVQATVGVEGGPDPAAKAPDVLITGMEASGVVYWIRYWLDPAAKSSDQATDTVARSVLRHLQLAGIPLSEKVVLHREERELVGNVTPAARAKLLGRLALFHNVNHGSLDVLAESAALIRFEKGEVLIRQGGEDHEMFLLVEGAVEVLVEVDGREVFVAPMHAGDYFGEMSLLTGEPRTATIRAATGGAAYRIGRQAITPLLEANPDIMDQLSHNLASRNLRRHAKESAAHDEDHEEKRASLAKVLLGKMISVFRSGPSVN